MKKLVSVLLCMLLLLGACAMAEETDAELEALRGKYEGRTLTIGVWGGKFAENVQIAFADPFSELTGCEIILEEYTSDGAAKLMAQVQQDLPGYDIVSGMAALDQLKVCYDSGAILALEMDKMPNVANVLEDCVWDFAIGIYACTNHIAALEDEFPNGVPTTAADFFDVENYPGTRALVSYIPVQTFELALLADGVAPEDLYPLDVERALAKLDVIKPYVTKYWGSGSDITQMFTDGEAAAGYVWPGYAFEVADSGIPLNVSFESVTATTDCWAVAANTDNLDICYDFINFACRPEYSADFCERQGYGSVVQGADQYYSPEYLARCPLSEEHIDNVIFLDCAYWWEHFEENQEIYLEWLGQ